MILMIGNDDHTSEGTKNAELWWQVIAAFYDPDMRSRFSAGRRAMCQTTSPQREGDYHMLRSILDAVLTHHDESIDDMSTSSAEHFIAVVAIVWHHREKNDAWAVLRGILDDFSPETGMLAGMPLDLLASVYATDEYDHKQFLVDRWMPAVVAGSSVLDSNGNPTEVLETIDFK